VWKLDGLSEYDARRPMTPTGTNLLDLVKHVGAVAAGYFGEVFDRPFDEPWWAEGRRDVTLHRILVHVLGETGRHAGHADIVRELIDGSAGLRGDSADLPEQDDAWWAAYRQRLEDIARTFAE
jgi:hypothetical protein